MTLPLSLSRSRCLSHSGSRSRSLSRARSLSRSHTCARTHTLQVQPRPGGCCPARRTKTLEEKRAAAHIHCGSTAAAGTCIPHHPVQTRRAAHCNGWCVHTVPPRPTVCVCERVSVGVLLPFVSLSPLLSPLSPPSLCRSLEFLLTMHLSMRSSFRGCQGIRGGDRLSRCQVLQMGEGTTGDPGVNERGARDRFFSPHRMSPLPSQHG